MQSQINKLTGSSPKRERNGGRLVPAAAALPPPLPPAPRLPPAHKSFNRCSEDGAGARGLGPGMSVAGGHIGFISSNAKNKRRVLCSKPPSYAGVSKSSGVSHSGRVLSCVSRLLPPCLSAHEVDSTLCCTPDRPHFFFWFCLFVLSFFSGGTPQVLLTLFPQRVTFPYHPHSSSQ